MIGAASVPSAGDLIGQIEAWRQWPVALQTLWDGDSDGWGLFLEAVFLSEVAHGSRQLTFLRFGSDMRLFTGAVPP